MRPLLRLVGTLTSALMLIGAATTACAGANGQPGAGVVQFRAVLRSVPGECPESVPNPAPSKVVTVRDAHSSNCDQLGPAGLVINRASAALGPALQGQGLVIVNLTLSQDRTYHAFTASHKGADIAVFALGVVQWAEPPGITYLNLFSCKTACVPVFARDVAAAKEIVRALSGKGQG